MKTTWLAVVLVVLGLGACDGGAAFVDAELTGDAGVDGAGVDTGSAKCPGVLDNYSRCSGAPSIVYNCHVKGARSIDYIDKCEGAGPDGSPVWCAAILGSSISKAQLDALCGS